MTISVDGGSITFLNTKILQKKNPHKNRHLISGGYRNIGTGGGGGGPGGKNFGGLEMFLL